MPELPEVESIVRCLAATIKGQRVSGINIQRQDILVNTSQEQLNQHLYGQTIKNIQRRGKYIVMGFGNDCHLVSHLRMSGSYRFLKTEQSVPYIRLWFELETGCKLAYVDKRALGRIWLYLPGEELSVLAHLGPEPLDADFTPEQFRQLMVKYRRPIKPLLLDQTFIAGIGNIYASEILYQAGIHPTRPVSDLRSDEISRLYQAIRQVLEQAVTCKGTHFSDYADPEGNEGEFAGKLKVYQKAGTVCEYCGETIQRMVQQQRSTYWCPGCQG